VPKLRGISGGEEDLANLGSASHFHRGSPAGGNVLELVLDEVFGSLERDPTPET